MENSKINPETIISTARAVDPPVQWSWHHRALLQIRSWLMRKREEREASIRAALERGGTDSGDMATEERENTDMLVKLSHAEVELTEVEAALERIRLGTYGICVATGRSINPERLRALPWTRFSYDAATHQNE